MKLLAIRSGRIHRLARSSDLAAVLSLLPASSSRSASTSPTGLNALVMLPVARPDYGPDRQ